MQRPPFGPSTPFFVVTRLSASLAHYVEGLGFSVLLRHPKEDSVIAMVARDFAQILLKEAKPGVQPVPNCALQGSTPWDVFIHTEDPEAYAKELAGRGISLKTPLAVRGDGILGFEIADPDGFVCFFGRIGPGR